eukprot:6762094-Prymnesium_polylepis.2
MRCAQQHAASGARARGAVWRRGVAAARCSGAVWRRGVAARCGGASGARVRERCALLAQEVAKLVNEGDEKVVVLRATTLDEYGLNK